MKSFFTSLILSAIIISLRAQQFIVPNDNLVIEGIPQLPASIRDDVKNYTESRGATILAWHPSKKEMIISTRFANSNQLHYVKMPGGDRKQITFFDEPINIAAFGPKNGDYFLFLKDVGGNEFNQIYRYDVATMKTTLLTDGKKSQNGGIRWSKKGDRIAYASTRRNGQDRDIVIMNPVDPGSGEKVVENTGGGWNIIDWSADDTKLLVQENISINETRLYLVDLSNGNKTRILPAKDERTTFFGVGFSKDDKGIYLVTNKDNEFNRLSYMDMTSKRLDYLTTDISWGVEEAHISLDKSQLAFSTNENGVSKLYILSTATNKYMPVTDLPVGVVRNIEWSTDSESVGISMTTYSSPSDVFEYHTKTKRFIRWTESEVGGMNVASLREPRLISWKSFDGKMISGYLYQAASKFSGKRPVMINIHGGPEGQSRPVFLGQVNYFTNELGISIIYPNVRGSAGYGKTFLDLDNGVKREESVKDIGTLIDWIAQQPELDKDRIMIIGGSYGGYMTLAVSYLYSDKIRCSVDIVGISNFNTFMKNTEAYRRDLRRVEYGDERDPKIAAYFESIAPINHAEKIKKPIFIVQGGNDPRVPLTESIQMKDKIKQQGGIVWYLMAKDEGHGFRKKNNTDFQLYSTTAFIKQFLLN